jgi:hypothetical protein
LSDRQPWGPTSATADAALPDADVSKATHSRIPRVFTISLLLEAGLFPTVLCRPRYISLNGSASWFRRLVFLVFLFSFVFRFFLFKKQTDSTNKVKEAPVFGRPLRDPAKSCTIEVSGQLLYIVSSLRSQNGLPV